MQWYDDWPWSVFGVNKRKHAITGEVIQGPDFVRQFEHPPKFLAWFDTEPWHHTAQDGDTVRHNS